MSSAYDKIMLLPIAAKFAVPFILPYLIEEEDNEKLYDYIGTFMQFLMIVVAMLTRRYYNCDTLTFNGFGKAIIDAFNINAFSKLVPFLMGFVPFLGVFLTLFETLIGDQVNNIFWIIGFLIVYPLTNKFSESNIKEYCDAPFFGYTSDKVALGFAIAILAVTSIF
jgi:hypothetical protein